MINSETIKQKAIELGADIVGIGDMSRFEGTDPQKDPRNIAPGAKSIIGLGFRVLRGSFRGIEAGTQYYQLPSMGISCIDETYAPMVIRRLSCFLEDYGFEGVVQRAVKDRRPAGAEGINPEMRDVNMFSAVPVAPGKPAPDVLMDFDQAAFICGMGEMGLGGFFLTPEFGPFQRFAFIMTDAELEPDPLCTQNTICDNCEKCLKGCPGKAIMENEFDIRNWAGSEIKTKKLDEWQCSAYFAGAHSETNPFLPADAYKSLPDGDKIAAGEKKLSPEEAITVRDIAASCYGGVYANYNPCICGKSCQRECYIHLEEKGVLTKNFSNPFRTEKPWRIKNKPAQKDLKLA